LHVAWWCNWRVSETCDVHVADSTPRQVSTASLPLPPSSWFVDWGVVMFAVGKITDCRRSLIYGPQNWAFLMSAVWSLGEFHCYFSLLFAYMFLLVVVRQCLAPVQASIHCWLDYCNALLAGAADIQMKRLQAVQNTTARLHTILGWLQTRDPTAQHQNARLVWICHWPAAAGTSHQFYTACFDLQYIIKSLWWRLSRPCCCTYTAAIRIHSYCMHQLADINWTAEFHISWSVEQPVVHS